MYHHWKKQRARDGPCTEMTGFTRLLAGSDDELMSAVIKIQCAWRRRTASRSVLALRQRAASVSGGSWVECDDGEGHTYYYNTATEECVWEKPEGFDGAAAGAGAGAGATPRAAHKTRI